MKKFENNTARELSINEQMALLKCQEILMDAFRRKIYMVAINPNKVNYSDIHSIMFAFNISDADYKRD